MSLHVDVRMRQKAGTQSMKIKSAKSFVEVHPRKFIPSKYTRYTVYPFTGQIVVIFTTTIWEGACYQLVNVA